MISTNEALKGLVGRINPSPWVCLDTEADSLHAYPEKICLIQVTTPEGDELVDPLAALDLKPFLKALSGHELIMHGSDYDLRLFRKHYDFVPSLIFDTMLASRLLGIAQFGLTNLAQQFLGVTLDKGPQKADWAQRPLTERMEVYARNDTHYLKPLADKLRADLQAKGRHEWQRQSCARLIQDCAEVKPVDTNQIWRIKGGSKLSLFGLAILRELWHWRESEAIASNRPPYFILRHESLVDIADAVSFGHKFDALIPPKYSERRRAGLLAAIERGVKLPASEHPEPVRHISRRLTETEKKKIDSIQKRRDAKAAELGIDPTLIASRATMVNLAEDWDKWECELMEWQRELLK